MICQFSLKMEAWFRLMRCSVASIKPSETVKCLSTFKHLTATQEAVNRSQKTARPHIKLKIDTLKKQNKTEFSVGKPLLNQPSCKSGKDLALKKKICSLSNQDGSLIWNYALFGCFSMHITLAMRSNASPHVLEYLACCITGNQQTGSQ